MKYTQDGWEYRYRRFTSAAEAFYHGRFFDSDESPAQLRFELDVDASNLMEGALWKHMGRVYQVMGERLHKPVFPLYQSVCETKAVAFRERVKIDIVDDDGRVITPDYLDDVLWESGLFDALRQADENLIRHHTAAVWFKIGSDGRLIIETLPPYCLEADGDAQAPGDVTRAARITVPFGGNAYPADADEELRYSYVYSGGVFYGGFVDPQGRWLRIDPDKEDSALVHIQEAEGGAGGLRLRIQTHPVVIWREEEVASPFAPVHTTLMSGQNEINLTLARITLAFARGAHGQPYLKKLLNAQQIAAQSYTVATENDGVPTWAEGTAPNTSTGSIPNVAELSGEFIEPLVLPEGWDIGLVQPRVDPYGYIKYVEALIRRVFVAEGMNANTIIFSSQGLPANYSGRAKLIDAEPTETSKQRREPRLRRHTIRTLNTFRPYHNMTDRTNRPIPEGRFRVRFSNLWSPMMLADQSSAQAFGEWAKMGIVDPIDLISEWDGVSQEEAVELYKRRMGRQAWAQNLPAAKANEPQPTPQGGDGEAA